MYTRCHSITSFFQKTVLLKDSKYNSYMHRKLHSESMVMFSKIENKLKPLKRCFSGAPKNKEFSMGTRIVEGVGFTRKNVPKRSLVIPQFPRELIQQIPPRQLQQNFTNQDFIENRDTLLNYPVSVNNNTRNDKGSITIVLDRSDICNCASPNEDVTIHVTTTPKITPKRVLEALSEADLTTVCNAKCSCCQRSQEFEKSSNPRTRVGPSNPTLFQPVNNDVNKLSLPQPPNLPSMPLSNFPPINDGFTLPENYASRGRSLSMDNLRKMIFPSDFEPKIEQLPKPIEKIQQHPQVNIRRSESRQLPSVNFNNNQKLMAMSRIAEPNFEQRRANSSFHIPFSQNKERSVPRQQPLAFTKQNFVIREQQITRSRQQNSLPLPTRPNLDGKQIIQRNNGRGGIKINEGLPFPSQQSQTPVNRVLKPTSLDPNNRFWSRLDVVSSPNIIDNKQYGKSMPVSNQEQRLGPLFRKKSIPPPNIFHVVSQPKAINQLQAQPKNRFPEKRGHNASGGFSPSTYLKLRPLVNETPQNANFMRAKNYVPNMHSQKSTTSVRGTSLTATNQLENARHKKVDQKQFLVQRQPPLHIIHRKANSLELPSNPQIRNRQEQKKASFIPQQQPPLFPPNTTRPPFLSQQMNKDDVSDVNKQPSRLVLKKGSVPNAPNIIDSKQYGNPEQRLGPQFPKKSIPPPNIFQVVSQPKPIPKPSNQLQSQTKTRFTGKLRDNASGGISTSNYLKLRPLVSETPQNTNFMRAKNYLPSRGTSIIANNQSKNIGLRRQPPPQIIDKRANSLGLPSIPLIRNSQQQNVKTSFIPQQPLPRFPPKTTLPTYLPQQMNTNAVNVGNKLPPRFLLKKRTVPHAPNLIGNKQNRNQKQRLGPQLPKKSIPPPNIFQVVSQPKSFNQLQAQPKNRFPVKRSYNASGESQSNYLKLRTLVNAAPSNESFMRAKNYLPKMNSRGTSLTATNQLENICLRCQPPPQIIDKRASSLGIPSNPLIRNRQQQNVKTNFISQQPPPRFPSKTTRPTLLPQQMNKNDVNVVEKPLPRLMTFVPQQLDKNVGNVVNKQPPRLVLKNRSVSRPAFKSYPQMKNRQQPNFIWQKNIVSHQSPATKQRSSTLPMYRKSLIPVSQNKSLPQRNFFAKDNVPQKQYMQPVSRFRNMISKGNGYSLIPVRKNRSTQNISLRNNSPTQVQTHDTLRRKHSVLPFGMHSTQRKKMNRDKLAEPSQRKQRMLYPRQRRNDIRKMNQDKLQSSLPMNVITRRNSGEYVEIPKSLQPVPISKNIQLENIPQIRQMPQMLLPPMKNFVMPEPFIMTQIRQMPQDRQMPVIMSLPPMKNFPMPQPFMKSSQMFQPFQKDCRVPQPPLKYYRKSALRTKQPAIRRDKFKSIATKELKTDDINFASNGNPAVLFHAPGKLKLVSTPVPRLTDEKGVIVKMLYVHLTYVDAQMLASSQNGPYKLTTSSIAGRAGSGVIVDVGKQVENVKIGDIVSLKPISCGKCSACKADNVAMCKRIPTSEKFGILKRFHIHPAKFVTKLPNKVNPIDGAMMDELSSAIRACQKSAVTAGDNVLILDGGSLGLWTALAAKSMGATNVCLADTRNSVLEYAKKLGIDRLYLVDPNSSIENTSISIFDYMEGDKPRVVFDCSGSSLTNQIAINTAKIGGKVVLMKNVGSNQPIVLSDAIHREIDILVSQHGNENSEQAAVQFLGSGKVQLNGINSCLFDISNVHEAFRLLNTGTTSNIFIELNRLDEENIAKKESKTS